MQNHPLGLVRKVLDLLFIVSYLLLSFLKAETWKKYTEGKRIA